MTEFDRKIVATFDLDGPKMFYPTIIPPSRTARELFAGGLELPPQGIKVTSNLPQTGIAHTILAMGTSVFHQIRPVNKEAIISVYRLINIAHNQFRTDVECNVLTARERDYWDVTRRKLRKEGLMDIFKNVYMNPGWNAACWKEHVIETMVKYNPNIENTTYVHFDDDLRAGLAIARINDQFPGEQKKVFVYVFRNFSNRDFLLKRGNPPKLGSITLVNNHDEALHDIWLKI